MIDEEERQATTRSDEKNRGNEEGVVVQDSGEGGGQCLLDTASTLSIATLVSMTLRHLSADSRLVALRLCC